MTDPHRPDDGPAARVSVPAGVIGADTDLAGSSLDSLPLLRAALLRQLDGIGSDWMAEVRPDGTWSASVPELAGLLTATFGPGYLPSWPRRYHPLGCAVAAAEDLAELVGGRVTVLARAGSLPPSAIP